MSTFKLTKNGIFCINYGVLGNISYIDGMGLVSSN